ncbi:MAG: SDR family NAD(P)-dependent oxidoreductase [Deltaproteobacteria bacterium]|nr:SDR family NAD(P)-dependent oxidoreductase [Deltaproteobacteria bacterium]
MQWDMERDSAFVTGGGSGIGQAIALKLGEQKVRVAVADVDGGKAEDTAARITAGGGTALPLTLDVTRSDQVNAAIAKTHSEFGGLAYLMNVAGISQQKPVHEISDADWARMIDVHLNGTFYCIRAALPLMMEAKFGAIASLSSMHGLKGQEWASHYSAAKAGIAALTKAVAREVSEYGIRINALAPGPIDTPMWRRGLTGEALERRKSERSKMVPLGRLGEPSEVADLAVFLLSPASSYMTGQIVGVNGGELMP